MKTTKAGKQQKTRTPTKLKTEPEISAFTEKLITARRYLAGLTQEQLANILSVDFGIIQRLEKNKGSIENFIRVLTYLNRNTNVDMNSLFDESKEPRTMPKKNSDDEYDVMETTIS